MVIEILYCSMEGYLAKATRAAAQIKRALDRDATLVTGAQGEFTIRVDGNVVFDKAMAGDFPTDRETVMVVRAALAQ